MNEFNETSISYTKSKKQPYLKKNGIYFTPKTHRKITINAIKKYIKNGVDILEPSCGSGEFIRDLQEYKNVNITGVELNKELFDLCKTLKSNIINEDFLKHNLFNKQFDIIIGNPPYFELKKTSEYYNLYKHWFDGRTNIYSLFILQSIQYLKPNGIIAFVIPPSWLSGKYFQLLRNEIKKSGSIAHLEMLPNGKFMKTSQEALLFVFEKSKKNNNYEFIYKNNLFYSIHNKKLLELTRNCSNISDLKGKVLTGPVVWNQHKDKLVDENEGGILLVYTQNIVKNEFVIKNNMSNNKKQYIKHDKYKSFTKPCLIFNRGFGSKGTKFEFNYIIMNPDNYKFTCENHTNVIYFPDKTNEEGLSLIQKIVDSIKDKRTEEWCEKFLANGVLSKTELENYLPIFI
uniref:site-specific DNA-methyltransferase (adenine-specific) n=1 Tax=viral metagenome TaxID=1070528 RepID=A0A6C0CQD7_9ZZZZ